VFKITKRKYLGALVVILCIILLLAQTVPLSLFSTILPGSKALLITASAAGLIIGSYLLLDPIGALITTLGFSLLALTGCDGGGGGGGEEPQPDLGEPPSPPSD